MSFLSKLFGGGGSGSKATPDPVTHKGFLIFPEPMHESGGFRIAARIEKEINGEVKVHHLVRADVYQSQDAAIEASIAKAQQMIDQVGDPLFG